MRRIQILGAIAALCFAMPVLADNHEDTAVLSDVWMFAAKPGMRGDLRDGFKEYFELRKAAGESREYTVYAPVISDAMGRLMIRSCCFDWADQDAYLDERDKVEGLDGKFEELVRPYVDHMHHYLERIDTEHSNAIDGKFEGPYYGETTWMLSEGYNPEAGEARRAISKELLDGWASEENQWLWLMRIGGKPALSVVNSFENYADMAPAEESAYEYMLEKHGEEKTAEMFKNFSMGKASSSYTVWRLDNDASLLLDD